MNGLGLSTVFVQVIGGRPTGTATVSKDATGEPVFTIHRPATFDFIECSRKMVADIETFSPEWLYMGTLLQPEPAMEKLVHTLLEALKGTRCFYDINLRSGHWNLFVLYGRNALESM